MSLPHTVLVAIDVSQPAADALDWALDYAKRTPCELHVVHVVERWLSLNDIIEPSVDRLQAELREVSGLAERELAKMVGPEHEPLQHHVCVGNPANEICQLAGKLNTDLIVVGTHGYSGIVERLVVGSVARKVVRDAPCTVVTVKSRVRDASPATGGSNID